MAERSIKNGWMDRRTNGRRRQMKARYATFDEVALAIRQADVGGSVMAREEATAFIVTTLKEAKLMPSVTVDRIAREKKAISTLGMAGRVTRSPGAHTVNAEEATVTYGENELSLKKTMLNFRIDYEATMFNIEGKGILSTLDDVSATSLGNCNEDLGINGDVAAAPGADQNFLIQNDGWITLAEEVGRATHKVNWHGLTKMSEKFEQAIINLPAKWRSAPTLAFICNDEDARSWNQEVAAMNGAYQYYITGVVPPYSGIPIIDIPIWPKGTIMLTPTRNLHFGVHIDNVRREADVDIETQELIFVWSMFTDYEYGINDAVAISKDRG